MLVFLPHNGGITFARQACGHLLLELSGRLFPFFNWGLPGKIIKIYSVRIRFLALV